MEYLKDDPYQSRMHTYVFEFKVGDTILQGVFSTIPSTPVNENELKEYAARQLNESGIFSARTKDGFFIGYDEESIVIIEDLIYDPRKTNPAGTMIQLMRPQVDLSGEGYFKRLLARSVPGGTKDQKKAEKEKKALEKVEAYREKKALEQQAISEGKPLPPKPSKVAIDIILERVIEHFSEPRKMTEASKDVSLGLQYQKIRYALFLIRDKGFKDTKYDLIESEVDECKAFQLVPKK